MLHRFLLLLPALLAGLLLPGPVATAQCTGGTTLATAYNTNNGQRGAMFDVRATTTLTVTCFDANLYVGTTADYEIYYKAGTFVGSENTAGDWTLAGRATNVTSLGQNVPTPLPIAVNVVVPAGQTYAFYVTNTFNGGLHYTEAAGPAEPLAADANLALTGGVGKAYPFGVSYSYRAFNGTVHYRLGAAPLPVELTAFTAEAAGPAAQLRWRTASEKNNAYFEVQRSLDGRTFAPIGQVAGHGSTTTAQRYAFRDAQPGAGLVYYRLRQVDYDGTASYSAVRAVSFPHSPIPAFTIAPNPARAAARVEGLTAGALVVLLDATGRRVAQATADASGAARLAVAGLPAGVYVVRSGGQARRLLVE